MPARIVTEADWPELQRRVTQQFPHLTLDFSLLVSVITDDDSVGFGIGGLADDGERTPQSSPYISIQWARLPARSIVAMAKVFVDEWIRLGHGDLPMYWPRGVTAAIDRFSRRGVRAREPQFRGRLNMFELTPHQVRDRLASR